MKKTIPEDAVLLPDNAELKFEGKIFSVYQWPQPMFDGSEATFEMLKRTDTVNAICLVDNKILLLDDIQPHAGGRKSLPGGRVDKTDPSIEAAIKREVQEETGYSFNNWRLVKVIQPYAKMEWFVHTWLAWEVAAQQDQQLDAGEKITVSLVDLSTMQELIRRKAGYLHELSDIFYTIKSPADLLNLPEFKGQAADR